MCSLIGRLSLVNLGIGGWLIGRLLIWVGVVVVFHDVAKTHDRTDGKHECADGRHEVAKRAAHKTFLGHGAFAASQLVQEESSDYKSSQAKYGGQLTGG